ncbi:endolytic transglycosylase MltG [Neobacillus sp. CF12]|uniref:endolytic transglycosylase MltG n=1 Tax=Neobacillus sp. CF12 TaxID=3055864 RepID=UPI0025A0DCFA|nr:endolytic transglycosylase MltG [Neobacillus sp. CF12]MDM5330912.1 endolytic transglycosylase MltG [Neobacillus sp. CF12]
MSTEERHSKKEEVRKKMLEHQSEARIVRKIVLMISILTLFILVFIGGGGYLYIKSALQPVDKDSKAKTKVEIPIGSSVTGISQKLEDSGIIKNAKVFKYYVKFKNEAGFMAGEYELSPSMEIPEIINRLKTGKVLQQAAFQLTIPEGKQLKEIAQIIAKTVNLPEEEVFNQLNDRTFIQKMMGKFPSLLTTDILNPNIKYPLEGYLFPATYPFYKQNPTVEEMVVTMLEQTQKVIIPYLADQGEEEFTAHQLLTMSSLIEEEATKEADRKKISSVFYNRIEQGMPLQTDPTVLYAQGKHKERVLYEDLEVDSPYNTYKHKGLPPGPIANAGKDSLEAAVQPADTKHLYFLATPEGKVLFTDTLDEHNAAKAEHITNQ